MEIYEETFESISFKLKEIDGEKAKERTEIPEDVDDDDALDMFMESAKEREGAEEKVVKEDASKEPTLSMDDEVGV